MDLKGLQLGNIVMINGKQSVMDTKIFHAVLHGFDGYNPEPIKLNGEWFDRLHFNKETYRTVPGIFYSKNGISYYTNDISIKLHGSFIYNVKYVHQLQNLYYSLTGEELTLNNRSLTQHSLRQLMRILIKGHALTGIGISISAWIINSASVMIEKHNW